MILAGEERPREPDPAQGASVDSPVPPTEDVRRQRDASSRVSPASL